MAHIKIPWTCPQCGETRSIRKEFTQNPSFTGRCWKCHGRTTGMIYGSAVGKTNHRHGLHGTPIYRVWSSMIKRCINPQDPGYRNYGERGITVCESWRHSFEAFYADMGDQPPGMSLDRVDNDGPYSPGNCRWATVKEQANNRRTNRLITYNGETKPLSWMAHKYGINECTLAQRIFKLNWPIERALTQPIRRRLD